MGKSVSRCITVTTVIDGTNGANGYNTAVVQLFRRYTPTQAAPTPALPTGTLTYTFSTGKLTPASSPYFNGWSQEIPSATSGGRLFVTMATARSQESTAVIPVADWSAPVEYVSDAVLYSLEPSDSVVNFRSNAVGEFSPASFAVTCKIKKTVGNTTTVSTNGSMDDLHLYYLKVGTPFFPQAYGSGATVTQTEAMRSQFAVTAVKFILSSATVATGITDANTVATVVVAVMCDGRRGAASTVPGPTGAMGKMFFPMGVWDSATTYTKNDLYVPLVWRDDPNTYNPAVNANGNYWYLNPNVDSSQGDDPNTDDNEHWLKANQFGLVITQGIFAEFAKLGRAVMSGDYLFSMNGRIDNMPYNAGSNWKDRPAYTLFGGDPARSALQITNATKSVGTTAVALHDAISLGAGEQVVLKLQVAEATATTQVFMGITDATPKTIEYSTSAQESTWTTGTTINVASNTTYYIRFTAPMMYGYYLHAKKTSGSANLKYSLTKVLFSPNMFMDFLSGDAYMRNIVLRSGYFSGMLRTVPTTIQCSGDGMNVGQFLKKGWLAIYGGSVIGSNANTPALRRFDLMQTGASIVFRGEVSAGSSISDENGDPVLMHLPFVWAFSEGSSAVGFDSFIDQCTRNVTPAFADFSNEGSDAAKRERMRARSYLGCEIELLNLTAGVLSICGVLSTIEGFQHSVWQVYNLQGGQMIRLTCKRYNDQGSPLSSDFDVQNERIAWDITSVVQNWNVGGNVAYRPYFDERYCDRLDYAE